MGCQIKMPGFSVELGPFHTGMPPGLAMPRMAGEPRTLASRGFAPFARRSGFGGRQFGLWTFAATRKPLTRRSCGMPKLRSIRDMKPLK